MKTPSKISVIKPNDIDKGHLCLLKLNENIYLALSCLILTSPIHRHFMLINKPTPDGKRLIDFNDLENFEIYDLGMDFSIKVSMHPDNITIGINNHPDNILICAKSSSSNLDTPRYMFVGEPGEGKNCIDIDLAAVLEVKNRNTNVNFHSWKILDRNGEIIYSYPPSNFASIPQN